MGLIFPRHEMVIQWCVEQYNHEGCSMDSLNPGERALNGIVSKVKYHTRWTKKYFPERRNVVQISGSF